MEYEVIGKLDEVMKSPVSWSVLEILESRRFTRWYKKNKVAVDLLATAVPAIILNTFGVTVISSIFPPIAVPVAAGFFDGHGRILLHMLVMGFVTLVITTFLKFTGRGDLIPLVAFVSGAVILYEVMSLFNDIYTGVKTFLQI